MSAALLAVLLLAGAARAEPPRLFGVALEADDAAELCPPPACSLTDFWDRAAAMGVHAAVVREKPLRRLAERGEVLHVPREEFEKWKALGLVSPGATLQPDSLWIKDPRAAEQVLEAVSRRGVAVSTSAQAPYMLIQFAEGYAAVAESLGVYESGALLPLEGRGLIPVYVGREDGETRLGDVALRRLADGTAALYGGAEPLTPADALLRARTVSVEAPPNAVLRAAWAHPRRLLVFRMPAALGRERAFELLRERLRDLQKAGPRAPFPAAKNPEAAPFEPAPYSWAAAAGLWLVAVLGGLLSARCGLVALKASRRAAKASAPMLSPVAELFVGLAACLLAAQAFGWAARLCLDALGQPLASRAWQRAVLLAPVLIGLLTLYPVDPEEWSRRLRKPLTGRRLLEVLALLAAAALVLEPRGVLSRLGLTPALAGLDGALPWWATLRWREALVGFPCLLHALFLVDWRLDCPDCESLPRGAAGDPRTWFIPGLVGPAGVIVAASRGDAATADALVHSALAALMGALIGAVVIARRVARVRHAHAHGQVQGPIAE